MEIVLTIIVLCTVEISVKHAYQVSIGIKILEPVLTVDVRSSKMENVALVNQNITSHQINQVVGKIRKDVEQQILKVLAHSVFPNIF